MFRPFRAPASDPKQSSSRRRRKWSRFFGGAGVNDADDAVFVVDATSTPKIIEKLVAIVERNRERLVSGDARLSLTPSSLLVVNTALNKFRAERRLRREAGGVGGAVGIGGAGVADAAVEGDVEDVLGVAFSSSVSFRADDFLLRAEKSDLQTLEDALTSTRALKISHGGDTILGRIRLTPLFDGLESLELKRVPIHLVVGISSLRPTIKSLTVIRSLSSLEEVFVKCGGDLTLPSSWTQLRSVNLSCNGIVRLDASLRLLPRLYHLDLSHNLLFTVDHFLEYLPFLRRLNLSHNRLSRFPSLSYSARRRLIVLALRGNNLDGLDGLEALTDLKEFDCRDNCICETRALEPLAQLHLLRAVAFLGNPVAYLKDYRSVSLQFISRRAATEGIVVFDGIEISQREIAFLPQHPPRLSAAKESENSDDKGLTFSLRAEGRGSGRRPKGKGKGKKERQCRLAREAVITDADDTAADDDDDNDKSFMEEEEDEADGFVVIGTPSRGTTLTPEEISTMKAKVAELRLSRGHDWLRQWPALLQGDASLSATPPKGSGGGVVSAGVNGVTSKQKLDSSVFGTPSSVVDWSEAVEKDDQSEAEAKEKGSVEKEEEKEKNQKRRTMTSVKDYGVELHSFIVSDREPIGDRCPFCSANDDDDDDNKDDYDEDEDSMGLRFLSLTRKYILVKDLDGRIVEELDTSCLLKLEKTEDKEEKKLALDKNQQSKISPHLHPHPSLALHLDYVRKDRRLRRFWFEDAAAAGEAADACDAFVALNRRKAFSTSILHCLRCSHEFPRLTSTSSSSRSAPPPPPPPPPPPCPSCRSPLVVEVESASDGAEAAAELALEQREEQQRGEQRRTLAESELSEEVARVEWRQRESPKDQAKLSSAQSDGSIAVLSPRQEAADLAAAAASSPSFAAADSFPTKGINFFLSSPVAMEGGSRDNSLKDSKYTSSSGSITVVEDEHDAAFSSTPRIEAPLARSTPAATAPIPAAAAASSLDASVGSGSLKTPSGSFVEGFSSAASITKAVFQNMAASVIASSLGASSSSSFPSPSSASTLDSRYVDAVSSPEKKGGRREEVGEEIEGETRGKRESGEGDSRAYSFSFSDFSIVDHRLRLFFDLILFGDEEDFVSVLRADVVKNGEVGRKGGEENVFAFTPALVVVSTTRIYFLKITKDKIQGQPDSWLSLMDEQLLTRLAFIDWGLGRVSFRLEFAAPGPSYGVIIRDVERCLRYIRGLIDQVKKVASSPLSQLESISKKQNPISVANLGEAIGRRKRRSEEEEDEDKRGPIRGDQDPDDDIDNDIDDNGFPFHYFLAFDLSSSSSSPSPPSPVTLVLSAGDLFLLHENFHRPFPRLSAQPPPQEVASAPQFVVRRRIGVVEVASVETEEEEKDGVCSSLIGLRLSLFDQSEPVVIGFETLNSRESFLEEIAKIWEKKFGIELEIEREKEREGEREREREKERGRERGRERERGKEVI